MDPVILSRIQFGITSVYHFFFVPLTIGLGWLVAVMQTKWYRTRDESWLRLTKLFGKLFLINFAAGVVTGIVQEFQFGMNWSEYSRFVGDIFGAPLAVEALVAFFLESIFIGLWIFGWERLPKKLHLATIYLTALGSTLSAIFILAANAWMQNPVGAVYRNGRAELSDFSKLFTNPFFTTSFAHVVAVSLMTAGGLVCGVGGWWLAKNLRERKLTSAEPANSSDAKSAVTPADASDTKSGEQNAWRSVTKLGAWVLLISSLFTIFFGDLQGKAEAQLQPAKLAASEGLFETSQPAPFSFVSIFNADGTKKVWSLDQPGLLSFLAFGDSKAKVLGIDELRTLYAKKGFTAADGTRNTLQEQFAPKLARSSQKLDYIPDVWTSFYTFRLMMVLGLFGLLLSICLLLAVRGKREPKGGKFWTFLMFVLPLSSILASAAGWILTEIGRQPWIVNGVLPTSTSVSPTASNGQVLFSIILLTLVYGVIAVIVVKSFLRYIKAGLPILAEPHLDDSSVTHFAY